MSTVEPVVGVFALRTFRVSVNGYLVPATQYSDEWATGAAIARCSEDHQAPDDDCTCGLYSMNNIHQLRTQYTQARRLLTVVALEGQTIEGTKGWRSQAARVVDIWTAPTAVPEAQLAQLVDHLPGVRFHTDVDAMLARYPELSADPRPRRTALTAAAHGTWRQIRTSRISRNLALAWAAFSAVLVGILALISTPRITPSVWVELASIILVGAAIALVVAELPGQLIVLAIRGGTMPLVLAPWRPVKHLWRAGSAVLLAGLIASAVLGYPVGLAGAALTIGFWMLVLLAETFLCALHGTAGPTTLPVLIGWRPTGQKAVRTGWEPARPGRRTLRTLIDPKPFKRNGIAPINITPPTGN